MFICLGQSGRTASARSEGATADRVRQQVLMDLIQTEASGRRRDADVQHAMENGLWVMYVYLYVFHIYLTIYSAY